MRAETRLAAALGLAASTIIAVEAGAQTGSNPWPTRPIEMIIAFGAGGGVDIVGRSVGAAIAEQVGQNVVVVNREGAGGTLGFGVLAAAPPDGHTLGFGPTTPIANAPYLVKGVRYDVGSFDYICQVFENVFTLAVAADSKFKSAQDLFAAAAREPGKLTFGHAGLGTIPHLSVENLGEALKLKFTQVPFRGDAPTLPVLIKGDLDFAALAVSSIRGQNLRPLVVFAGQRHPAYPDVPTAKELGVAHSVPPGHNGVFAPKGLPAEVRAALEKACAAAVRSSAVAQATANTSQTIRYLTGAEFQAQTVADHQFKGELIRRLGLEVK
jgi:tripartite-type tricarboxylate transporter receptor subunit TctC